MQVNLPLLNQLYKNKKHNKYPLISQQAAFPNSMGNSLMRKVSYENTLTGQPWCYFTLTGYLVCSDFFAACNGCFLTSLLVNLSAIDQTDNGGNLLFFSQSSNQFQSNQTRLAALRSCRESHLSSVDILKKNNDSEDFLIICPIEAEQHQQAYIELMQLECLSCKTYHYFYVWKLFCLVWDQRYMMAEFIKPSREFQQNVITVEKPRGWQHSHIIELFGIILILLQSSTTTFK